MVSAAHHLKGYGHTKFGVANHYSADMFNLVSNTLEAGEEAEQ